MEVVCDIFGTHWANTKKNDYKRGDVISILDNFFLIKRVSNEKYFVAPIKHSQYSMFDKGSIRKTIREALMNYDIEKNEEYEEIVVEIEMAIIEEYI